MRLRRAIEIAALALALADAPRALAASELPSVARARYGGAQGLASGTVFFLDTSAGPVVVGAAHSFDLAKLAASPELAFELGRARTPVAAASRVLAGPGIAFAAEGGSLATDFLVFALDAPPNDVRVLAPGDPKPGMDVKVLGIPGSVPQDQDEIGGHVVAVDAEKLELDLDRPYDVRGWGGAPVVTRDGHALGIVQAARPSGKTMRIVATPIGAVTDAVRLPLEGGRGRGFAAFATGGAPAAEFPAPAPPPVPERRIESSPVRQTGPQQPATLAIEYPEDQAVIGKEAATFVAGRALAPRSEGLSTDVVFVVDVSGSTSEPSGADVNGNGIVGSGPVTAVGGLFALGSSDPGDSVLAAEIAAVRRLLTQLDPRFTRVGLVTFSGEMLDYGVLAENPAQTEVALTTTYEDLQRALDRVLARGPRGGTHMAAGVDRATAELVGSRGAFSHGDPKSEKIIVFLTDGMPTLPFENDEVGNINAVMHAAERAHKSNVRVFAFGIGEQALAGPLALIDLARITDGSFTPVRDPARLSDVFAEVDFADIEQLVVRNTTLGVDAHAVDLGADGSFGAFVDLAVGRNAIQVTAVASDGRRATRTITVHYAPDALAPELPPALLAKRNKVLELRLTELRRERIASEQAQVDQLRDQLRREIEQERAKAEEQARIQRKKLEIKVDPAAPAKP